jgi:hypothetical protein
VQKVIGYFNVIWDEAEELERLAALSDPRVVIDTAGLSPELTRFANRLARSVRHLTAQDVARLETVLDRSDQKSD